MPLTDVLVRSLKPGDRKRKIFDGGGLYLEITPAGAKGWRLKYRFQSKEKRLSLGVYPDVGLKDARAAREQARKLLAEGIDPSAARKAAKLADACRGMNSFEAVTREWIVSQKAGWASSSRDNALSLFENDLFPVLGTRPIAEITAPELLVAIRRIERRVLGRAHRALSLCGQVFRYAIATGRCERNPGADLRGALPPYKGGNFAAPTEPNTFAPLLRALYAYKGSLPVSLAMRLAPMVFVRPGELRKAKWADIDFETAEWRYISSKTKKPHIVPLARQAVEIFRELQPLTGRGTYVFPCRTSKNRPMSDNAVLIGMRRSGIEKEELTGHGLRATARTILDEVLGFRPDFIEHQLAHKVKDPNGTAYNRTAHLEKRRKMMQAWADYCDKLRSTEILEFPKRA